LNTAQHPREVSRSSDRNAALNYAATAAQVTALAADYECAMFALQRI